MRPVRWGIISTAMIARDRMIPAMHGNPHCEIIAVASRDGERARAFAAAHGIPRHHDSYEALLADGRVEAVYIPLPNHLHLEWTRRAAEAGKHVLCEKPLTITVAEAEEMIRVREATGVVIEEAFMCRDHPQWHETRRLLGEGRIGAPRALQACFTYMNRDADDIRNDPGSGGGGLRDIGSYTIAMARLVFGAEPRRMMAALEHDPAFATDRQAALILEFPNGLANLFCATQVQRYERLHIFGEAGWMALEAPYVQPPDHVCRILIGQGPYPSILPTEVIEIPPANHYALMAERFGRLVRGEDVPHWPLETARDNMAVIEALLRSAAEDRWVAL